MSDSAVRYWEDRALRFAAEGSGLRAVCSYGMPEYYNRYIQLTQRLALAPWLDVRPGARALDVGCGVGRWSRRLARRGARVTGVDLSYAMLAEARRRSHREGLAGRCRFLRTDVADLALDARYDLVLAVTVLQHLTDPGRFHRAAEALSRHLDPGGRLVLLEAAPTRANTSCDHPAFRARSTESYREALTASGLVVERITGVDPAPFKTLLLPRLPRLPAAFGRLALGVGTAASLTIDVPFGRRWVRPSWHKVFVCRQAGGPL